MSKRYASIYIDLQTGEIGKASEFDHAPHCRQHRFLFVGKHNRVPAPRGRIVARLLKERELYIEVKRKARKPVVSLHHADNYF